MVVISGDYNWSRPKEMGDVKFRSGLKPTSSTTSTSAEYQFPQNAQQNNFSRILLYCIVLLLIIFIGNWKEKERKKLYDVIFPLQFDWLCPILAQDGILAGGLEHENLPPFNTSYSPNLSRPFKFVTRLACKTKAF